MENTIKWLFLVNIVGIIVNTIVLLKLYWKINEK